MRRGLSHPDHGNDVRLRDNCGGPPREDYLIMRSRDLAHPDANHLNCPLVRAVDAGLYSSLRRRRHER